MPVIDASANARIIQQGANDLLGIASLYQRQREIERYAANDAADADWRSFQRQRMQRADDLDQQQRTADSELDQYRLGMMQGPEYLPSLGGQALGPPSPGRGLGLGGNAMGDGAAATADHQMAGQVGGMGGGGGMGGLGPVPASFGNATPGARSRLLGAMQAQALSQPLEATLQAAVKDGLLDVNSAGVLLQQARQDPAQADNIVGQITRLRHESMTKANANTARLGFLETQAPRLQQLGAVNPHISARVSDLVEAYKIDPSMSPGDFRAELEQIEKDVAGIGQDDQRANWLRGQLGAGFEQAPLADMERAYGSKLIEDRDRLRRRERPNESRAAQRKAIEDRISVAKRRLGGAEEKLKSLAPESPLRGFWQRRADQYEAELTTAENELTSQGSGAPPVDAGGGDTSGGESGGGGMDESVIDEMIRAGKSDEEIAAFMQQRAGG